MSAGEREFVAICICGADNTISPCGICRQALREFGDISVISVGAEGNVFRETTLGALLPDSFGPDNLK